ncbi:MAG: HEPN domain-containing protein [Anaerolineae bacterium]|nr:HEPN domain-containing protein [Anaerolineae bacterium]
MAEHLDEVQRWMDKAHSSLKAAETLIEDMLFAEAISRAYYAMFYAAKALLLRDGVDVSSHSAVVAAVGRVYVKDGRLDSAYHKLLIEGFDWRQKSDYDVYWTVDRYRAERCWHNAQQFVGKIERMLQADAAVR